MWSQLLILLLVCASAYCDDTTFYFPVINCESHLYKYDNNSCLETCATGYISYTFYGTKLCYAPCATRFLYQDDSCQETCGQNFVFSPVDNITYCNMDPSLPITENGDRCPDAQYRYQNRSCLPTCSFPYKSRWDLDNAVLYCDLFYDIGCPANYILEAEGCVDPTAAGYTAAHPYQDTSILTAALKLDFSFYYDTSRYNFNSNFGFAKLAQKIASILDISTADIGFGDPWVYSSVSTSGIVILVDVTVRSLPDQESIKIAQQKVDTFAQKLDSAVQNGDLNVLSGGTAHDYSYSTRIIVHSENSGRNSLPNSPLQVQILESSSSGKGLGIGLAVGLTIIAVITTGFFIYRHRRNKAKQMTISNFVQGKVIKAESKEIDEEAVSPSQLSPAESPTRQSSISSSS